MLFNSFEYLIFLPLVFLLYWFVFNRNPILQNALLVAASYVFYGWWSWRFLGLLVLSTLLDFTFGFLVDSSDKRKAKWYMWLSVVNNLGILLLFKYYDFFVIQIHEGLERLGLQSNPRVLQWVLPIGISFYTFHGMSYVFDIYRGKLKPVKNFLDYAVFVSFFPLLVAGPIERANHLLPQVIRPRSFDYTQAVQGCRLILWGMFKKVVVADSIAETVDKIFGNYHEYSGVSLILGAVAFSFQIYADFSGYSDIAIGSAKLLGFELLSNFKFPFFSRDIAEFWRRWHISLSSWFRDYLYIPLGGSREGRYKAVRNTFIIFLISGFWHGASWNFIVWGAIHALGFMPLLLSDRNRKHLHDVVAQERSLPTLLEFWQMASTFVFVTFAFVFFRSPDLHAAIAYLGRIAGNIAENPSQLLKLPAGLSVFLYIIPLLLLDWWYRRDERILRTMDHRFLRTFFYLAMFLLTLYNLAKPSHRESTFIYFQF
jgi:alginate O-acetyltransferase complex protein AlgI